MTIIMIIDHKYDNHDGDGDERWWWWLWRRDVDDDDDGDDDDDERKMPFLGAALMGDRA